MGILHVRTLKREPNVSAHIVHVFLLLQHACARSQLSGLDNLSTRPCARVSDARCPQRWHRAPRTEGCRRSSLAHPPQLHNEPVCHSSTPPCCPAPTKPGIPNQLMFRTCFFFLVWGLHIVGTKAIFKTQETIKAELPAGSSN